MSLNLLPFTIFYTDTVLFTHPFAPILPQPTNLITRKVHGLWVY